MEERHEIRGNSNMCLRAACDNRDSLIGIVTRLTAGKPSMRGPISGTGKGFFFFSKMLRAIWGPFILLFNVYEGLFPCGKATIVIHPVPRVRMSGAVPPLSNAFMACTGSNFPYIYLKSICLEDRK